MLRVALWIVGLAVAAFVVFAIVDANDPTSQAKASARNAIELCWSEQSRKSLTPGTQRFVAGACEQMERDFVQKYHARP